MLVLIKSECRNIILEAQNLLQEYRLNKKSHKHSRNSVVGRSSRDVNETSRSGGSVGDVNDKRTAAPYSHGLSDSHHQTRNPNLPTPSSHNPVISNSSSHRYSSSSSGYRKNSDITTTSSSQNQNQNQNPDQSLPSANSTATTTTTAIVYPEQMIPTQIDVLNSNIVHLRGSSSDSDHHTIPTHPPNAIVNAHRTTSSTSFMRRSK